MQPATPAAASAATELEMQSRRLAALVERADTVRHRLPSTDAGAWRGPTWQVYSAGLSRLRVELAEALTKLEGAATITRRAAASSRG